MEKNTKDKIRKEILGIRNSMSDEDILVKSNLIFKKLTDMDLYKNAGDVLIYASMGSEVRTDEIIEDALNNGKNVFCPKCTDIANGVMEFVKISGLDQLVKGYYGIREPVMDEQSVVFSSGNALMIMPLVAFDDQNNRIGYKGGYYDRYLEKHRHLRTCALAFSVQKSADLIPAEVHDIKPEIIITEL